MDNGILKQRAKDSLTGNWGNILLLLIVYLIVTSALGTIPFAFLIIPLLTVGYCRVYLHLIDGKKAELNTLFENFNRTLHIFAANFLAGLYTFLWSLLLFIPGIIKAYSYSMVNYVLADNPQLSPTEALEESQQLMDGNKMNLFMLHLSFLPWFLLSIITCGLAGIYVGPYMSAATAHFYRTITDSYPVEEDNNDNNHTNNADNTYSTDKDLYENDRRNNPFSASNQESNDDPFKV